MTIDTAAAAILKIIAGLAGRSVSGESLFVGAKALLAGGGLSRAWLDIEENRWSDLVDLGITDAAAVIAAVDPPLAPLAPLAAALIIYARHHPAGTLTPAMLRADGQGGSPSTSNVVV